MDIEHYFDWAATAPPDMDIITSAIQKASQVWANPSSAHGAGRAARGLLENARNQMATILKTSADTVYFTSGGTESNHIVLLSQLMRPNKGTVLISGIEHPAVREQALVLARCGIKIITISPNDEGIITADAVMSAITSDTTLVCVMAVNNETGAICPVSEIAQTLHSKNGRHIHFHTDCVQAAGKVQLNLNGVDSAAFSAHKISGPRGIGALYIAPSLHFEPFLRGGGQEHGVRSGTENTAGALAYSACMKRYCIEQGDETEKRYKEQCKWTNNFIKAIMELTSCRIIPESRALAVSEDYVDAQVKVANEAAVWTAGKTAQKWSPWIVQAAFIGIPGQVMLRALDDMGFSISTGSACSTRKRGRPVLDAMGISYDISNSAVRFSFGHSTTEKGMNDLVEAVREAADKFYRR